MKNLKISTELASAVLGKEVTKCSLINKARNSINITYFEDKEDFNTICREWNIYEFAFKCKEWIINKEYHINTSEDSINNYIYLYKMVKNDIGYEIDKSKGVQFDSKGYIINLFEACEWILEQNK